MASIFIQQFHFDCIQIRYQFVLLFEQGKQMLSFTHHQKKILKSDNQLQAEQQYYPITITNGGSNNQVLMPEPLMQKKKIIKSHSNKKHKKSIQRTEKPYKKQMVSTFENKPWNSEPYVQKAGVFDKKLSKNALAAAERQIRAQSRIKQNGKLKMTKNDQRGQKIINKQHQIHKNKLSIVAQEQEKQILRLKQMIQLQRLQKQKNDRQYQLKKKKIQAERKQLIQIEKQIQRQGPKATKQIKQRVIQMYPSHDNVRLKEGLDQRNPSLELKNRNYESFGEITQSESIANQKNRIRQQQLEYLVGERERHFKQYQRNTLGYTPTLIPLLSRASYKIISTHISSLVELLVDDMLEQQVHLLEAIQLQAKVQKQRSQHAQIINDYRLKIQNLLEENDEIEEKIGKYSQMKFSDIYRPVSKIQEKQSSHGFSYVPYDPTSYKLQLKLTADQIEQLQHRIGRFKRYVGQFDQYKPNSLKAFEQVTEQVINQAIKKLSLQLDNGAGQFVNIIFRNQFD